ncbi:hypothetical protein L1987_65543 [Smallanthus sonchifolius]|uniref:Uncharacterized protein n=1 Tax=Smallanthus sonchifolius TaxID=185202 RepID=A0ACB9BUN1_9ASTR|nr:hypothetical protein L1987_65543 [Smallanthus sonchifolius]
MGACCSKNTNTTALTPAPQQSDLKSVHQQSHNTGSEQQLVKKEIFVIKHRISHEIDRHSDQGSEKNPSATTSTGARLRTSSCSKDEVDAILVQCDRVSRSNSAGAQSQNPNYRRRYSRSKRSFDLGVNIIANASNDNDNDVDDEDDALNHHHHHHHDHHRQGQSEVRVSSSGRSSSKERRISISPSRRSSSKERRISISPSGRSESPFPMAASGGSSNRPAKMVSVPATDKSSNAGPVKRIHVKRNVSPARSTVRVFTEYQSQEQDSNSNTREAERKSLVEIDNNAGRSARLRDTKRTRKFSWDLDVNPETVFDPSPGPSPPSYASLLLEDIHNFHKKNTNAATTQPAFALPECVSKACLIMEAVADLNSNTSSLCSDDRWRNTTAIKKDSSGMAVDGRT